MDEQRAIKTLLLPTAGDDMSASNRPAIRRFELMMDVALPPQELASRDFAKPFRQPQRVGCR